MSDRTPTFSRNISLGNLIQILVVCVGFAAAWFAMDLRSQANTSEIVAARLELKEIEERLRNVENDQARSDERYNNLLTLLSRIDARLERIEAAQ